MRIFYFPFLIFLLALKGGLFRFRQRQGRNQDQAIFSPGQKRKGMHLTKDLLLQVSFLLQPAIFRLKLQNAYWS
ncbi:hypothetical protein PEDI_49750 [Persicobacter diffluens]|uniref:Uncharacterized protein n=1 Tax=Persicobacter diffluens TaxID=981 RepID=A0AAN5AQ17_9BACT|nr:hypothetical protein PEDI_49750 [Persicobacter diffluens]